jgi:hypothetical protein
VTTRVKNGHNVIISYTGTAWATMGMVQFVSESAEASQQHHWFSPLRAQK